MSNSLFFKRLKRRLKQWIDPEFDGDRYANRDGYTYKGSDYYALSRKIIGENIYYLFVNEDDEENMFFRKLILEDGEEFFVGLDDRAEFDVVWKGFTGKAMPSASSDESGKSNASDFSEETEKRFTSYEDTDFDKGDSHDQ